MLIKNILLLLLLLPSLSLAAEPAHLIAMQMQPSQKLTRITFILTKQTTGKVKYLPNPDRVILELTNTDKKFNLQNARIGRANVISINSETAPDNLLRFIFSVTGKVTCKINFSPNGKNKGVQLQLEIVSEFGGDVN